MNDFTLTDRQIQALIINERHPWYCTLCGEWFINHDAVQAHNVLVHNNKDN